MDIVEFWTICSTNNVVLDSQMRENIERYEKELKYWNEKVNLVSRKDDEYILERHILHSLSICKYYNFKEREHVLDVGTGGGLPGIPIKIANPEIRIDLVDSIGKKSKITNLLAQHTGLTNINTHNERVEEFLVKNNKKYDTVIARAVTRTVNILDWCDGYIKNNGRMLLLKGGNLSDEISEAKIKYPKINIEEISINLLGFDYFKKQEKKLLIIKGF